MSVDIEELSDSVALSLFSARHWHSGQWSTLYAWSSSGAAVAGLSGEARRAAEDAERLAERLSLTTGDREELEELITDAEALAALAVWAEERGL